MLQFENDKTFSRSNFTTKQLSDGENVCVCVCVCMCVCVCVCVCACVNDCTIRKHTGLLRAKILKTVNAN